MNKVFNYFLIAMCFAAMISAAIICGAAILVYLAWYAVDCWLEYVDNSIARFADKLTKENHGQ